MIRLFILIVLAFAAWQASIHYPTAFRPVLVHEVVVHNKCSAAIERVRVTIADETRVCERIEAGGTATLTFPVGKNATFFLVWIRSDRTSDAEWRGGQVATTPQRHTLTFTDEHKVDHFADALPSAG